MHKFEGSLIALEISDAEKYEMYLKLSDIGLDPYDDFTKFKKLIQWRAKLPETLTGALSELRNPESKCSAILFRNLPLDASLPGTPVSGERASEKSSFVTEAILSLATGCLGEVFGYDTERDGELIHNIVPTVRHAQSASSLGYVNDFKLHTEVAYHPRRPDFVALLCLRSDAGKNAGTVVADIKEACGLLSANDLWLLKSSYFHINPPESFFQGRATQVGLIERVPLISGSAQYPVACLDFNPGVLELGSHATDLSDVSLRGAVDSFEKSLASISKVIYLEPGDLLIVSNL
jgi:L-asparagine oxygenase